MQTLKKVVIVLTTLSFLLVVIGFFTPGWMVVHVDPTKMAELQMKKAPIQIQQQYKQQQLMRKQHPEIPEMKSMNFYAGPFYVKYCIDMKTNGNDINICPVMSSGDIISMLNAFGRNNTGPMATVMQTLQQSGSTITLDSIINTLICIVVFSSLVVIQIAVSLVLSIVYSCIRYPRKAIGIAGGISSIFSGAINFLLVLVFLIIYGQMTGTFKESMGEAGTLGFPYSTMLACFGAVLFSVTGGLLIRITLTSKDQFNYEMMVIDTSKGGGTYIAKT